MALIQAVGNQNGAGAATLAATIAASGSGNLLVAAFCVFGGSITSVTDSASQVYTQDTSVAAGNLSVWKFPNSVSGVTTVTGSMTGGGSHPGCIIVAEESGIVTATPTDQTTGQQQAGVTSWSSGATPTTTNANDVLYGFAFIGSGSAAFAPGSGYAALSGTGLTTGFVVNAVDGDTLFGERQVVSATGAYAATGTNGTNSTVDSLIAAYKQLAAAPILITPQPRCIFVLP